MDLIQQHYSEMIKAISEYTQEHINTKILTNRFQTGLTKLKVLSRNDALVSTSSVKKINAAEKSIKKSFADEQFAAHAFILWLMVRNLSREATTNNSAERSRSRIDEWKLNALIEQALFEIGVNRDDVQRIIQVVKIITSFQYWGMNVTSETPYSLIQRLLANSQIRSFIHVNRYNDILWFNEESFDQLLFYFQTVSWLVSCSSEEIDASTHVQDMIVINDYLASIKKAKLKSGYQISKLVEALK